MWLPLPLPLLPLPQHDETTTLNNTFITSSSSETKLINVGQGALAAKDDASWVVTFDLSQDGR